MAAIPSPCAACARGFSTTSRMMVLVPWCNSSVSAIFQQSHLKWWWTMTDGNGEREITRIAWHWYLICNIPLKKAYIFTNTRVSTVTLSFWKLYQFGPVWIRVWRNPSTVCHGQNDITLVLSAQKMHSNPNLTLRKAWKTRCRQWHEWFVWFVVNFRKKTCRLKTSLPALGEKKCASLPVKPKVYTTKGSTFYRKTSSMPRSRKQIIQTYQRRNSWKRYMKT